MRLIAVPLLIAVVTSTASMAFAAGTENVRRKASDATRAGSAKPKKFEPYDPDRMRAGGRPGFFDIGGGTEVRIGGRTRVEYQYTR